MEGYKPFTLQLNVNITSGPPTRLRFALRIVDFMERFIVSFFGRPHTFAVDP